MNSSEAIHTRRMLLSIMAGSALAPQIARAAPLLGAGGRFGGKHPFAPNSWMEVDLAAFQRNIIGVRKMLSGSAKLCAVMKADAYGVGIEALVHILVTTGVSHVGIASNEEARILRERGFRGRILRIRTATVEEVEDGVRYDLDELIGNLRLAQEVGRIGLKHGHTIRYHLALNSGGMSRNGLELSSPAGKEDALQMLNEPNLRAVGIMTHFASYEKTDIATGIEAFNKDVAWLLTHSTLKRDDVLLHVSSTRSALSNPESHLDMARIGALLYGYPGILPAYENVVTFKSRVSSVNSYPAGNRVSYDGTYTLTRDSHLANIPVGYSDGYILPFSNKGTMLIRGHRAPVVGKVTMNTTMVDVTDIPGVEDGDEVVLFGKQGTQEITTQQVEKLTGITLLDLLTEWGNSNPKLVKHG